MQDVEKFKNTQACQESTSRYFLFFYMLFNVEKVTEQRFTLSPPFDETLPLLDVSVSSRFPPWFS